MNPQLLKLLHQNFSGSLATLRADATHELNGTCFKTIHAENGERWLVVVCLTGEHEIRKAEKLFDLIDDGKPPTDWAATSLVEAILFTMLGDGFNFYEQRDTEASKRKALALISAEPRSITILELAFNLPP